MLRTLGGRNIGKCRLRAHQHPPLPPLSNLPALSLLQAGESSLQQRPLQAGHSSLQRQRLESDAYRCCGRDRCHSGGFLLRIMPPSWHPVPACASQRCCRRAIPRCSSDNCRRNHSTLHRFPSLGLKSRIDARKRT